MAKLTGCLFYDVDLNEYDFGVKDAVVTKKRIAIDWDEDGEPYDLLAHSKDGGLTYQGITGLPYRLKPGRSN
ncbi:MAG: hypothetical protein HY290_02110 [Planctomycetia bacterium]|nr:hypothetical protein [Planctomycetia bacterium]